MHVWWFFGSIGCVLLSIIHGQDGAPPLADLDPPSEEDANIILSVDDTKSEENKHTPNHHHHSADEMAATTSEPTVTQAQTPGPFACHECTNCNSKSDFGTQVCESGVNMCYKIHVRVDNASRVIRRGCSSTKGQCTVSDSHLSDPFDSITCCTTHKCNQATQFSPLFSFLLSTLGLFIAIITVA